VDLKLCGCGGEIVLDCERWSETEPHTVDLVVKLATKGVAKESGTQE
jgi:hypothetical protein